jgi:hypothetical protein
LGAIQRKVCLITNSHIASSPRLVKEAIALSGNGYQVHIIFAQYVTHLTDFDFEILQSNPRWTYNYYNYASGASLSKIVKMFYHKAVVFLFSIIKRAAFAERLLNRCYAWQLTQAIAYKADLYIAHNLGSIAIAFKAAKANHAKSGFDAEDFHRNEVSNDDRNLDVLLKTFMEEIYFPKVNYITASSPQIAQKYDLLFNLQVKPVLNVFPVQNSFSILNNTSDALKLFWFSQTIGPGRGIEMVIEAMGKIHQTIEFNLLGYANDEYKVTLLEFAEQCGVPSPNIHFLNTVYGDEIFKIAAQCDVGLATETGYPLNRDICLTNKLFTYIQSGLAVAASNTQAQNQFLNQCPQIGNIYNNIEQLVAILLTYVQKRDLLFETKKKCFELGQTSLNWENEQLKFLNIVTTLFNA